MQIHADGLSQRLEALIAKLPEERQNPLRELLMSLLEPVQKMVEHRDSLERLEQKYMQALEEDSTVINFRRTEKANPILPRSQRRWALKIPSLIEASSFGEIFRMAFELHLRSSKSIFLAWEDIDSVGRLNPASLLELTSCTIFIPDVTSIPIAEQYSLEKVIQSHAIDKPHLMAGTLWPYADLKRMGSVRPQFVDALSQAYLKLTKPVAQYKREGLIRYFLESLSY